MKTIYIINYLLLILMISEGSLSAQSGRSSQTSSSSRSANASHSSSTKASNGNSDSNSDTNNDDGTNTKRNTPQKKGIKISKTFDLKGDTNSKETEIIVLENETELTININSFITEGELLIEIYNPSGEKTGNCSLDCTESKNKNSIRNENTKLESASCSVSKSYSPPQPGKWRIIFRSVKATGTIKLEVN